MFIPRPIEGRDGAGMDEAEEEEEEEEEDEEVEDATTSP